MLKIPDTSITDAVIVGIDPGTETLGFSELRFDIQSLEITGWCANTYYGSKLLHGSAWIARTHGGRYSRLRAHRKNLIALLNQIEPFMIACESPFINMRTPQVYGALTEAVYEIRRAVTEHSSWKVLHLVEPSVAKNAIGAKGGADKEAVRAAIEKIDELVRTADVSISELDEHSLDGLAVAYAQYLTIKQNAKSLFSPK